MQLGGKAVSGASANGYGIYGTSTNGLAGLFDGNVAVFGSLRVSGSQVLRSSDLHFFDQSSNLSVQNGVATAIPGLNAVGFTVASSASVTELLM